jgi:hypothetical protein
MQSGYGFAALSADDAGPQSRAKVMTQTREVKLPEDLCAAAESKFRERFQNVEELVTFLLDELVHGESTELDRAEQAAVEQRLKDLGYL